MTNVLAHRYQCGVPSRTPSLGQCLCVGVHAALVLKHLHRHRCGRCGRRGSWLPLAPERFVVGSGSCHCRRRQVPLCVVAAAAPSCIGAHTAACAGHHQFGPKHWRPHIRGGTCGLLCRRGTVVGGCLVPTLGFLLLCMCCCHAHVKRPCDVRPRTLAPPLAAQRFACGVRGRRNDLLWLCTRAPLPAAAPL